MGTIITRYRIEDDRGRVLTDEGFFSSCVDDAVEFTSERAAHDEAAWFPGATVECFERYEGRPFSFRGYTTMRGCRFVGEWGL